MKYKTPNRAMLASAAFMVAAMLCPQLTQAQEVFLVVNRETGALEVVSNGNLDVDGYEIESPAGRLLPDNWNSLADQGAAGWEEANPTNAGISELNWNGTGNLEAGTSVSLGSPYNGGAILPSAEDVAFRYSQPGNIVNEGVVHYTGASPLPTISVDRSSGAVTLSNPGNFPIIGYSISSSDGSLNPDAFNGLVDQGIEGWTEAQPLGDLISELNLSGDLAFDGASFDLGNIYTGGELSLLYATPDGNFTEGVVDFTGAIPDLVLEVDIFSGEAKIQNTSAAAGTFDVFGYAVTSDSGSLDVDAWNSLRSQGDINWVESNSREDSIAELNTASSLLFETGVSVSLGNIFGGTQDLQFEYGTPDGPAQGTVQYVLNLGVSTGPTCQDIAATRLEGDLDNDGTVAFSDFLRLSGNFNAMDVGYDGGDINCDGTVSFPDFLALSGNFGAIAAASAASVPEPSSHIIALLAVFLILPLRKRQRSA